MLPQRPSPLSLLHVSRLHATLSGGCPMQAQSTELADTPGSRFAADCVTLIGEGRLTDLLSRLLSKADVIFNKAQDKGATTTEVSAASAAR